MAGLVLNLSMCQFNQLRCKIKRYLPLSATGHQRAKSVDVTHMHGADKHGSPGVCVTYAVETTQSDSILTTGNSEQLEQAMTPEELDYIEHLHGDDEHDDDWTDDDDDEHELHSTMYVMTLSFYMNSFHTIFPSTIRM